MSNVLKKPWDKLRDEIRGAGGDVLNVLGSDKDDPVMKTLYNKGGGEDIKNINKALGTLPVVLDKTKRATVLDAIKQAKEQEEGLATYDPGGVINETRNLQSSLGARKDALRTNRDTSVAARAQPGLQRVAEQSGLARRSIRGEGSRSSSQRADLGADTSLGNQQVQAQSLGEQLQAEGGVERLETEFTAFFNELASNRFSREISGLTEEMNEYLSEQGAKIGYDQLEAEARRATLDMYGRFAASLGQQFGGESETPNYNSGSVTQRESIFNS